MINEKKRCKGTSGHYGMNTNPPRPCQKMAVDGSDYCKVHSPNYIAPNTLKAFARIDAENAIKRKEKELKESMIFAIKQIADGHNNARELAQSLVKQYNL